MGGLVKLIGGLAVGAAIGVGIYLILAQDSEEGFVSNVKALANQAMEEGKRAAADKRQQLEIELGGASNTSVSV